MTTLVKTGRWQGIALLGLVVLTSMFFGLLIGAELHLLILAFVALVAALPVLYVALFGFEDRAGWLLLGNFGLMYVGQMAQMKGVPIGYLMELMIFACVLNSLRISGRLALRDGATRTVLLLFVLYFAVTLLSTLLGRSQKMAAIWQFQYNLKLPLMFALGMLMLPSERMLRVLRFIVAGSWLYFLPMLALEIAAPGFFYKLVGFQQDIHVNPLLGFGGRLQGPFAHSGYLAMTCGLLSAAALIEWMQVKRLRWLVLAGIYCGMVLLSGQRQEFFSLVLVYALFAVSTGRRHIGWVVVAGALLVVAGVFAALYMDHNPLLQLELEWGAGRDSQLSERAILTRKGLQVADQYFPLGSGLGTYGGAGAQKFDQSLFLDLGFSRYWWFRQGMFIVDTFWPSIVAESGYFGALLLMAVFAAIWLTLARRCREATGQTRALLLLALAALTLILSNSPTSAVIGDPRGTFVFWLIIGCAWRASVDNRATSAAPIRHTARTDFAYHPSTPH
ncbi:MAG: hypothetical protein V4724_20010 [Pseudomonadota bacterium]